jgi:hypothetical protein
MKHSEGMEVRDLSLFLQRRVLLDRLDNKSRKLTLFARHMLCMRYCYHLCVHLSSYLSLWRSVERVRTLLRATNIERPSMLGHLTVVARSAAPRGGSRP